MKNDYMKKLKIIDNSVKGIWFFGFSGSGKTTSASFLKKNIIQNALLLDGDLIRKNISFDLGYAIQDRLIQLRRIIGLCKIALASNVFPICSSVYMNADTIEELKKLNFKIIKIERDFNELKNMKIYKLNKNVLGLDLKYENDLKTEVIKNTTIKQLHKDLQHYFSINNL